MTMTTTPATIEEAPEEEVEVVSDHLPNPLAHEASAMLSEISAMTLIMKRLILMMTIISLTTSKVIRVHWTSSVT